MAKASRDGFVRHCRTESRAAAPTAKSVTKLRSDKYLNNISSAYESRPDLFPQARGQLQWEQVRRKRRKRLRSRRPLQRLFQEYVEEHKDELEAESARRHACAHQGLPDRVTSWPLSKAGWLSWLEQEPTALD